MASQLTHLDHQGKATMVDIGNKPGTRRVAVATGHVAMAAATLQLIAAGGHPKGDVCSIARIAGIQAAKQCAQLIPLCHPLLLDSIAVELSLDAARNRIDIAATCRVDAKTGVEMESLTAVSVAALTIYDMCKAVDREMVIGGICLQQKTGGRSGHFQRGEQGKEQS